MEDTTAADSDAVASEIVAHSVASMRFCRDEAHVIATDSHNADSRPPILSSAVEVTAHILGEIAAAEAMVTINPSTILDGKPLDLPEPLDTSKKPGRWKRWFGRK